MALLSAHTDWTGDFAQMLKSKKAAERLLAVGVSWKLGDALRPDPGFSAGGTRVFDYGPRSFTVHLTPALELEITNNAGKTVKNLPAPGKTDDEEKAGTAYNEFKRNRRAAWSALAPCSGAATVTTPRRRKTPSLLAMSRPAVAARSSTSWSRPPLLDNGKPSSERIWDCCFTDLPGVVFHVKSRRLSASDVPILDYSLTNDRGRVFWDYIEQYRAGVDQLSLWNIVHHVLPRSRDMTCSEH